MRTDHDPKTPKPDRDPYRAIRIALDRLHDPLDSLTRTARAAPAELPALRDEITKLNFCYEIVVRQVARLK